MDSNEKKGNSPSELEALSYLKTLSINIMENPLQHEWTLQGLGMLRTNLSANHRLHVWDSRYVVPNVSRMHNHPWDFESCIIAGELRQRRFLTPSMTQSPQKYWTQKVLCGEGGGLIGSPEYLDLSPGKEEVYREGDTYKQKAHEIHLATPKHGTVTFLNRTFKEDRDHARVFWPAGEEWVSAATREATDKEVLDITKNSLKTWFQ